MNAFLLLLALSATLLPHQVQSGIVVIYRVEEASKMESKKATVWLDGKPLVAMPEQEYIAFRVPPGEHVFKMKSKASAMPLTVEAGKTYYLRASQTAPWNYVQNLYKMDEGQARLHMKGMKFLEPKNIKNKDLEVVRYE